MGLEQRGESAGLIKPHLSCALSTSSSLIQEFFCIDCNKDSGRLQLCLCQKKTFRVNFQTQCTAADLLQICCRNFFYSAVGGVTFQLYQQGIIIFRFCQETVWFFYKMHYYVLTILLCGITVDQWIIFRNFFFQLFERPLHTKKT